MITQAQPLPVGNAVRLFLAPPAGAVRWRLLRKAADDFTGQADPSAAVVHDGDEAVVVDSRFLPNNQVAFYRLYSTADGIAWVASPTVSATPAPIYQEVTTDVLERLRERIEAGLQVECQRGTFATDAITVINASPALTQDLHFPLVTLHLDSEDAAERGIGDIVAPDLYDAIGDEWVESEGWLADVKITAIGWSLNADERLELRKALRRVLIANLPVYESYGWTGFSVSFQDMDALGDEYGMNMFQVLATITCRAPVVVASATDAIDEVEAQATPYQEVAVAANP